MVSDRGQVAQRRGLQFALIGPLCVAVDRVLHPQVERSHDFTNCLGAFGLKEDVEDVNWTVSTADSTGDGLFGVRVVDREAKLSAANYHDRACVRGGAPASLAIPSTSARMMENWSPEGAGT
jgi:hypothetical protein